MNSGWFIEQNDFDSETSIKHNESLFTLGNGYLGLRGDLSNIGKAIQKGTYINGFYEKGLIGYGEKAYGFAENWQTMVPLPEGKELRLIINGLELFNEKGTYIQNRRTLNMKESNSGYQFIWKDKLNKIYRGDITTVIPFELSGVAIFIWDITLPDDESQISITSPVQLDRSGVEEIDDPRLPAHFNGISLLTEKDLSTTGEEQLLLKATGSDLLLSCGMDHHFTGLELKEHQIEELENGYSYRADGKADKSIRIIKVLSYSYGDSKDIVEIKQTVLDQIKKVRDKGVPKILEEQKLFMDQFWSFSDVQIDGDDEAQISLRFNLFQMLQSTGRDGRRSIAAKGLSGPGYEGHYFWDAETYVLPFFIYTNPQIARSMLVYRISILDKAIERASLLGHEGALFPWRTINGEESSAYFPAGTAQYHINSDIALGLANYLEVTGDLSILKEGGCDLLAETARFWCSFGSEIKGKGFCFNVVTGPDEYTAMVDNNYFTNFMAKENLKAAVCWLKDFVSEKDIIQWEETAERVYLPENCEVTPQDDSFFQKEIWDFDNTDESEYPLLLNFHPLNIYRKQVLKQADVVMVQALHRSHFPPGLLKRNFEYYEELTTRDSSLSVCAQGINAHWLGYDDLSWEYFLETVHTDRKDLHNNVFYGLHTASMGGSYLTILKGFLGLENTEGTVRFRPRLPGRLLRIQLHLSFGKSVLKIILKEKAIEYSASVNDLDFYHYGEWINLKEGDSIIVNSNPELKVLIDDLGEKDLFVLEKEIFYQVNNKRSLPEETIIITDSDKKVKLYNSIGYTSVLVEGDGVSEKDITRIFKDNLNIRSVFRGKRPRKNHHLP